MRTDPSPVLTTVVRLASPSLLVLAAWLLVAGHNLPGGGFIAGLVVGAAIAIDRIAQTGILTHAWLRASALLGVGSVVLVAVSMAPLALGQPWLDQGVASLTLPVFGTVKATSALAFDVGVLLLVVGLITTMLDAFIEAEGASP